MIINYGIMFVRVGGILKKILITLLLFVLITTGCSIREISNKSVSDVFETILYVDNKLSNTYMEGYSLYIPRGIKLLDKSEYNLILKDKNTKYYLYIDTIAYYYKTTNKFEENGSHFYSKKFSFNNKSGYIDVYEKNDDYFVVLMYNYAKIETYVKKDKFNDSLLNMCALLSSIKYNDKIISGYIGNKGVIYQEEKFNIFSSDSENDNFLKYEAEYGTYNEEIKVNTDDVIDVTEVVE